MSIARSACDEGDYRWAAEVLSHVLFADEEHVEARDLQAATFEQLAFGAENGTWRNAFLSGASELRHGVLEVPSTADAPELTAALTVDQVLSALAILVDGPRSWDEPLVISFVVTDLDETHVIELRHGTLVRRRAATPEVGSTTFRLSRQALGALLAGVLDLGEAVADGRISVDGDSAVLPRLVGLLDPPDETFPIVTPQSASGRVGGPGVRSSPGCRGVADVATGTPVRPCERPWHAGQRVGPVGIEPTTKGL